MKKLISAEQVKHIQPCLLGTMQNDIAYTIAHYELKIRFYKDECAMLRTKLFHYENEAEKIANICRQNPCYFELPYEGRDMEFVMKLAKEYCPQICPKWRGGGR